MKKISIGENEYSTLLGFLSLAKNPNTPKEILNQLSNSKEEEILKVIANNPSTPGFVLEKIAFKNYMLNEVLKNPNCPQHLIMPYFKEKGYSGIVYLDCPCAPTDILEYYHEHAEDYDHDHYKMGDEPQIIWEKISSNPNAPDDVINYMSTKGLIDKIKKNPYYYKNYIDRYIEIAKKYFNKKFLDFLLETKKYFNETRSFSEQELKSGIINFMGLINSKNIERIMEVLLNKNCPSEIIYLASRIKFRTSIFNKVVNIKLEEAKNKYKSELSGSKFKYRMTFEEAMEIRTRRIIGKNNKEFDVHLTDIKKPTQKVSPNDEVGALFNKTSLGIKATIKSKNYSLIEKEAFTDEKGKHVYYGEYPYALLNEKMTSLLDLMYSLNMLEKTSKVYRILIGSSVKQIPEFTFENARFIKVNDKWYKVKLMLWDLDDKNRLLVSHYQIPFMTSDNYNEFINSGFKSDLMASAYQVSREEERESKKENDKFKQREKLNDDIEEAQRNQRQKDLSKEIEELESQIQQSIILLIQKKAALGNSSSLHTVNVSEELLYDEVDGHYEIKSVYIPLLKYLNLSYIDTTNLKVSGIDFRETNISINPQKVFNKDLSYASFSDENIIYGDFRGCDLRGTDISNESFALGLDSAIVDENTKLPSHIKKIV